MGEPGDSTAHDRHSAPAGPPAAPGSQAVPAAHTPVVGGTTLAALRHHPIAITGLVACYVVTLAAGIAFGRTLHAVGYVLASLVGVALIRRLAPATAAEPPRRPVRESVVLTALALTGCLAMCALRAESFGFAPLRGIVRLVVFAVVLSCMFPVAGTVFLWRSGARADSLGLRVRNLWLAPVMVAVVATAAFAFARDALRSNVSNIRDGLSASLLGSVALQALGEEVQRFQIQSRVAAAARSAPAAILVASLLWGLLHVPGYYRGDPVQSALGVVVIVPLGVLWGYASHRTSSLWPSFLAHICNVWGLQSL